jgi:hypothetical protein
MFKKLTATVIVIGALSIGAIAAIIGGCIYTPTPVSKLSDNVDAVIVKVYWELRIGSEDWTTVVKLPDGTRRSLKGKLGREGEVIIVPRIEPIQQSRWAIHR